MSEVALSWRSWRTDAENVNRAIFKVRPAGVDSHTGVEDLIGRKSREKIENFLSEAYEVFDLVKTK